MNKRCHRCSIEYSFRNYTKCNSSFEYLYSSKITSDYLATSRETCFEIKLLKYFDEQIIRNGVTFEGFSDSYNSLYYDVADVRPLNRVRLAEAWYSFKIKQFILQDPSLQLDFKSDSKSTESLLGNLIPLMKHSFALRWADIHKQHCKIHNCDSTGLFF